MKKIIIIEFVHYQYALTLTELFKDSEIIYVFSETILNSLKRFQPEFNIDNVWIYQPNNLKNKYDELINRINSENPDILCIDPIFDNFKYFAEISKKVKSKIIFTTHNINTWFRPSIRGFRDFKEKIYKKRIINNSEFIAVEDFIYNYLKDKEPNLFNKYKFVYIPYTIYYGKVNKVKRSDNKIKIVLPGSIDKERRRYEYIINVIKKLVLETDKFIFSFAGPGIGEYGGNIIKQLEEINNKYSGSIIYFKEKPDPEQFRYEMESADIVLSTSTKYFYTLGTKEIIGETKPTAAIHDMISFVLSGILPSHLNIPEELKTSSMQYKNEDELYSCIKSLLDERKIQELKENAQNNSLEFTSEKILNKNIIKFY